MKHSISDILKKASNAETDQQRIAVLRQFACPALNAVLQMAYEVKLKILLPPGKPPYTPSPYLDQYNMLMKEVRKFYLFLDPSCGGNPNLSKTKREMLFIQMLECIDAEDAKLMIAVKDRTIPYPNITRILVNEAFPGLLSPESVFEMKEKAPVKKVATTSKKTVDAV